MSRFILLFVLGASLCLPGCGEDSDPQLIATAGEERRFGPDRGAGTVSQIADEKGDPSSPNADSVGTGAKPPASGGADDPEADDFKPDPDKVVSVLEDVLVQVITGQAMRKDTEDLRRKLVAVLEDQRMGSVTARFDAADMTLRSMFRAVDDQGGPAKVMRPNMRRAIGVKAEEYADDLYRRLPMPGALGLGEHEGTLLKRAVDIKVPDGYEKLTFAQLGGYQYEEGMALPDTILSLQDKKVGIAGYIITLEEVQGIREFLLVESIWSCCFGTPPQVHEVIVATTARNKSVEYTPEAVLLLGKLDVGEEVEDGFVTSVYRVALDDMIMAK